MGDKTGIEWTDATWNPIRGCTRVSEGCRNCYAERVAARFSDPGQPYHGLARRVAVAHDDKTGRVLETEARWTGDVALVEERMLDPIRWRKPRMIFVNSMSDLFHEGVPDEWIWQIFGVMAVSTRHTFQILTKRPERMSKFVNSFDGAERFVSYLFDTFRALATCDMAHEWPLPNVWLGVSVEDQKTADERIPQLLDSQAALHWVSYEPALGPVNFGDLLGGSFDALTGREKSRFDAEAKIDWIVCGGESGPGARPMHRDWAQSARDQCISTGTPFFFKQWGEWTPDQFDFAKPSIKERGYIFSKVGKKQAGDLLDGKRHHEFPKRRSSNGSH